MKTRIEWRRVVVGWLFVVGGVAGAWAAEVRVGTCQFPVSADVAANGEWIRRAIISSRSR